MTAPRLLIVGRLRKAHGIRGDLVVEPITDAPATVFAAGARLVVGTRDGDPAPDAPSLTVARSRGGGNGSLIVHFQGIEDRTAAQPWGGRYLLAPEDTLHPPAAGEVYLHELYDMRVELPGGEPVGRVREIYELPQGLALEVASGSRAVLLPFREEFVRSVDRAARLIVATPPEGLFE